MSDEKLAMLMERMAPDGLRNTRRASDGRNAKAWKGWRELIRQTRVDMVRADDTIVERKI